MPKPVKIFFDGGCRGTDGRMELAVVTGARSTVLTDLGRGTSGDAEWLALIQAVRIARTLGRSDIVLLGDSADVIAKAKGALRCRGEEPRYLAVFHSLLTDITAPRVRRIRRSQNLAGNALARLHGR